MTSSTPFDEPIRFYIGHHDAKRAYEVTGDTLQHARDYDWDMLTVSITNDTFHSRVLSVLSDHLSALEESETPLRSIDGLSVVPAPPILSSLTPAETSLGPNEATNQLILTTSTWIDLASPDPLIANLSRQVLALEITYASFCGATNIMIQGPPAHVNYEDGLSQYAHAIQHALGLGAYLQVHISLPMTGQALSDIEHNMGDLATFARDEYIDDLGIEDDDEEDTVDEFASWDAWNVIRSVCKYTSRLSVALSLSNTVPSAEIQSRWFSEPLRILHMDRNTFQNATNGPQLSSNQTSLIWQYMRLRPTPWILLSDVGSIPGLDNLNTTSPAPLNDDNFPILSSSSQHQSQSNPTTSTTHLTLLRHLQSTPPPRPPIELFGAGYQDYLQNPLQPLADNLESMTYEVFEKDPIKYAWYERAIAAALRDWSATKKPGSGPGTHHRIVCAVVGAGRGPLVTRALAASEATGVQIEMWALEKNPNAFVLLQRRNASTWNNRVHLVHSDMRSWSGPSYPSSTNSSSQATYKIDILISELLGSLADNELSPECLDGVQHLLNPTSGISIPSSYTAHISPIAAPKIHADIMGRAAAGDAQAWNVPYVTMLHAIDFLSARRPVKGGADNAMHAMLMEAPGGGMANPGLSPVVREAWEFRHPVPATWLKDDGKGKGVVGNGNEHNERFTRLEFACRNRGVCHGLAGYFEAVLYDPEVLLGPADADVGAGADAASFSASAPGGAKTGQQGEVVSGKRERAAPTSQPQSRTKVEISTNPLTMDAKSRDMISWFPMFLPLKQPLYFPDESVLVVSMWRRTEGRGVWYEWVVEAFKVERRQGGGRSRRVRIATSELEGVGDEGEWTGLLVKE